MRHGLLLNYLYAQNHIPVWLLGGDGLPFYHSAGPEELRPNDELKTFFARFVQTAAAPVLYSVGSMELYAFFSYQEGEAKRTAVVGPAFQIGAMRSQRAAQPLSADYLYTQQAARAKVLLTPGIDADGFAAFVCVLLELLQGKRYGEDTLRQGLNEISLQFILNKALAGRIFNIREELALPTHDYEMEQRYLRCVREGDVDKLSRLPKLTVLPVKNQLSADRHRQFLYEMIALVTLITRAAIEGGLDAETAYMMSDLYIRRMDEARHTQELLRLSQNVAKEFALKIRAQRLSGTRPHSPAVQSCIEYIRTHLHLPISLRELAGHAGINDKYLSRLFIKETGMKLTEFIQWERVAEAKSLLEYSEHSLLDISNYLSFSSQSYFIKIFKKHTGLTPQQYRNKTHTKPWKDD